MNSSLVTRLPGLGLLVIMSTAFAAADSSTEPPEILDRLMADNRLYYGGLCTISPFWTDLLCV